MTSTATEDAPYVLKLPGFGLPLDFMPDKVQLFRNALDTEMLREQGHAQMPLTTLREFEMLNFMDVVTDKTNWHQKVFDETITSKWKQEALSDEDEPMTEAMIDWCIAELQYKTKGFTRTNAVSVYNGDVVKSDTIISQELKDALKAAASPLEQVPERVKDWHPHSNDKVLDLVHPSLFPLIYGRTRILPNEVVGPGDCVKKSGGGLVVPVPPIEEAGMRLTPRYRSIWEEPPIRTPYSRQFQWLPCDVDISNSHVKIKSYINNLHPDRHQDLYAVIEEIISRAILLWNMTLSPLQDPNFRYHRIEYTECRYDPDPESWPETEGPQQRDDEDEDDYLDRREDWYRDVRKAVLPEPGQFEPPKYNENLIGEDLERMNAATVDLRRDDKDRGLQIIVKLANIHLTPEKSTYEGGSWHVEGQLNEHICASAIYYYDSENITSSQLSFCHQTSKDIHVIYERHDHHDWLEMVYGCHQHEGAVQICGNVNTPEGRLLTWPNVLQHQVQPFEPEDPTKPGHRKILALFLVDPNIRIISTANVPCQRRDWWSDALRQGEGAIPKLPVEVQDHIFSDVEDFPINSDEAKELLLKLMKERAVFGIQYVDAFCQYTFNLCEH